jgi:hypothetical protein
MTRNGVTCGQPGAALGDLASSGHACCRVGAMDNAPPHRQLGQVSGLVVFAVGMGVLVLAIAFGANVLFNRSFGSAPGVDAATREGAASAPAAGSAPTQAGTQSNR